MFPRKNLRKARRGSGTQLGRANPQPGIRLGQVQLANNPAGNFWRWLFGSRGKPR